MPLMILRTIIVYFVVMAVMRLMGKRQLGELQPSELVSTILISNLASVSIESPELPLSGSIAALMLIAAMELLLSALAFKNGRVAEWMAGKPVVILQDGVIDQEAMYRMRFTANDLLEALRAKGIFDPTSVSYAAVETNGSLSVFQQIRQVNVDNTNFSTGTLPLLPLILDGKLLHENMALCHKDTAWLKHVLAKENAAQKDILMLLANDSVEMRIIYKKSISTKL